MPKSRNSKFRFQFSKRTFFILFTLLGLAATLYLVSQNQDIRQRASELATTQTDQSLWKWNGSSWDASDGAGVRISIDNQGLPWIVNKDGNIWRKTTSGWQNVEGQASDIDIGGGAVETTWVLSKTGGLWKWGGPGGWRSSDGNGVRIAVDNLGQPWVVNSQGAIWRKANGVWEQLPGDAKDIDIGSDNTVYIVGRNKDLWKWNSNSWVKDNKISTFDAGIVRVSVGSSDNVWAITNEGNMWRYDGALWRQVETGTASEIGIASGQVWILGGKPQDGSTQNPTPTPKPTAWINADTSSTGFDYYGYSGVDGCMINGPTKGTPLVKLTWGVDNLSGVPSSRHFVVGLPINPVRIPVGTGTTSLTTSSISGLHSNQTYSAAVSVLTGPGGRLISTSRVTFTTKNCP